MSSFKILRDIITFKGGGTPSKAIDEYWHGDIPWATVKDFTSTALKSTQDAITEAGLKNSSANLIARGHVIIPTRMALGKAAINEIDLAINQDLRALIPKIPLNADYLLHAILSLKQVIVRKGTGATVKGITQDELYNLEIYVPPIQDQIRIAHLLEKVANLVDLRKHNLRQLNDLLDSVFVEMFGDIKAKKSSHPWKALRPYLKAASGKSSKNVISDNPTGIPIFGGNGINGWATEALYDTPTIIAGRVGQQCGVIHTSKGPCWVTDNAIVLSITNNDALNIVYLASAFHYAPIRERVKQLDLPFINQSMLLDYSLPLPPLELQNKFASIVEKVESIKKGYQQSLTDLEALYSALSHQAFTGDLDLSHVPLPSVELKEEIDVITEPVQERTDKSFVLNLPETENLLGALNNSEERKVLIAQWLEAYRDQIGAIPFSVQRFMTAVQTRLVEMYPDSDFELGANDYECIKAWVFEEIGSGTLVQEFDDTGNHVQLKAMQA